MADETEITTMNDQRRFARVPFTGAVTYRYEPECDGTAMCADVSRGGMCLHLGRYLRPGKHVMLDAVALDGEPLELKAHVAWCRAIPGSHTFATGVRVYHDEPQSMSAMTAMVHEGLEQSGTFGELRTLHASRVAQGRRENALQPACETRITIDPGHAVAAGVLKMATAPSA